MTLAQLRTRLQARGYGTDTVAAQNEAINSAYQRVIGERRGWPFLEKNSTALATVIGQRNVATTSITDLLWVDAVRIGVGTTFYDLIPLETEDLRTREHIERGNGVPTHWTEVFGEIHLFPIPDKVYVVDLDYIKFPTELLADGDIPIFDSTFHDILVDGACYYLAFRERDYTAASVADQLFERRLRKMVAKYGLKQRQAPTHVTRSRFWDQVGTGSWGWGR